MLRTFGLTPGAGPVAVRCQEVRSRNPGDRNWAQTTPPAGVSPMAAGSGPVSYRAAVIVGCQTATACNRRTYVASHGWPLDGLTLSHGPLSEDHMLTRAHGRAWLPNHQCQPPVLNPRYRWWLGWRPTPCGSVDKPVVRELSVSLGRFCGVRHRLRGARPVRRDSGAADLHRFGGG